MKMKNLRKKLSQKFNQKRKKENYDEIEFIAVDVIFKFC